MAILRALAAILAIIALASTTSHAQLGPIGFELTQKKNESADATLQVREWLLRRLDDQSQVTIVVVVAPRETTEVHLLPLSKEGASEDLFAELNCPDPLVIINGGFYLSEGESSRPLGLLRVNRETLSEPSGRRFGGFLILEGGAAQVLTRNQRAEAEGAENALESTPIIIKGGRDDMLGDDGVRFDRVAIGTTKSGDTLVAGAFGEDQNTISLAEFSKLLLALTGEDRDPPDDVLAMDGGPSAHIFLPRSGTLHGDKGPAYLPNAVCIGARS